jgi:carbon storage regulator
LTNVHVLQDTFTKSRFKEVFMLVLSRKQNERIRVGESVVLTVVRVGGDKVRLGIEAPPSMRVLRDELEDDEEEVELALTSTLPHPLPRVLGFVG